jgi:hypothetical protein
LDELHESDDGYPIVQHGSRMSDDPNGDPEEWIESALSTDESGFFPHQYMM